jgi:hypothetical protein
MSISASSSVAALPVPVVEAVDREVRLRCFSYEERFGVMAVMLEALDQCGCWMESRETVSATQVEMLFAARLAASDELYSGLMTTGVDMTQESHMAMTLLCTRWRHQPEDASRFATIRVRLEVNFLRLPEVEMGFVAQGAA